MTNAGRANRNLISTLRSACAATVVGLAMLSFPTAQAAIVGDFSSRLVTEYFTYPAFGGGDVIFRVSPAVVGCEGGFWLSPSDPGFVQSVAAVYLMYRGKLSTRVWGWNEQLWTGTAAPTCKVYAIGGA
jgi:hypothetical protein